MAKKTFDEAVVSLLVEINSQITWSKRAAEVEEYRRGYREALTGLTNSVPMIDVMDALRELGWQPPRTYWGQPLKAKTESQQAGAEGAAT